MNIVLSIVLFLVFIFCLHRNHHANVYKKLWLDSLNKKDA